MFLPQRRSRFLKFKLFPAVLLTVVLGCESGSTVGPHAEMTGVPTTVLERLGVTQAQVQQVARRAARDSTVNVWAELRALGREARGKRQASVVLGPMLALEECQSPDGGEGFCPGQSEDPDPSAGGYWVDGWTPQYCFNPALYGLDADLDGVTDGCENAIAYYFRPELVYSVDCIYDAGNGRIGGDYSFAVRKVDDSTIRVIYPEAFYIDCAEHSGHSGDSEFIQVQ